MIRIRFLRSTALVLALSAAAPAFAQEVVAAPNPDADKLAGNVRRIAADPRDTLALLDAGDLSARLGDTAAALAFFARVEAIDPTHPRILSGRASTLVRLQRPGEALRLFQQAEGRGLRVSQFAGDRGWAYDLLGAPDLAQRDYRTALAVFREDETVRRYALSLGITGDVDQAMKELDPLLRRSDRAAWRARAFILAMNGDLAGADRIASTMMPGNMGAALSPFFRRLANLSPADRAFAVHFGELTPTQARLADARMAPDVPRYQPRPKPVELAAAPPPPAVAAQPQGRDRRSRRDRERDERVAAAAPVRRTVEPVVVYTPDLPAPPQYVERREFVQPTPAPAPVPTPTPPPTPAPTPAPAPAPVRGPAPVQVASRPVIAPERFTIAPAPQRPALSEAQPETLAERPLAPAPTPPGPARPGEEDSVLAAIVGSITIPADELAALSKPVEPAPEPVRIAELPPRPAPVVKPKPEPAKPAVKASEKPEPAKPGAKAPAKPDPKAAKPDPKKPDAKKPVPKKPDPAKAEPARVWVQVAGGANPATLAKAWAGVVAKAPALMKGKSGWWTPLRATNRVLAGPFKTSAEAQAFVNAMGKAGASAFVFTSEAGQKVTPLK